jgi:hypothetical protein
MVEKKRIVKLPNFSGTAIETTDSMDISVKVIKSKPEVINRISCVSGQIQIGDFTEKFIIPLEY